MNMEKKDKMFQFAHRGFGNPIIENTDLITEKEANDLWEKYLPECIKRLESGDRPQMCIWKDCEKDTDYHTVEKEINYYDCFVENGCVYKKIEVI